MSGARVVLASGSPRRLEILRRLGFSVEPRPSAVDEALRSGEAPEACALRLAAEKAASIDGGALVLAADTVVHLDGAILDKPADRAVARAHLTRLSGRWHRVTTGFCVARGADRHLEAVTTEVRFRALDAREIEAYLATGEADDKAGAYGIQGVGGVLVAEVRGSWTNVMGLPAEAVVEPLLSRGAARFGGGA